MGLSRTLIVFPLLVLTLAVVLNGGGGLGYSVPPTNCTANNNCSPSTVTVACPVPDNGYGLLCKPFVGNIGGAATGDAQYTCTSASGGACRLPYDCPSPIPSPTRCSLSGDWILPQGDSIIILYSAIQTLTPIASSPASGLFGPINATGFIIIVGIASTIALIGGISFFGSGENAEGIHIAWMVALLLGLWTILSTAEGFIVASPSSFFIQLDSFEPGIGTLSYVFLTLLYTLGTIGAVSRSSGSGGV